MHRPRSPQGVSEEERGVHLSFAERRILLEEIGRVGLTLGAALADPPIPLSSVLHSPASPSPLERIRLLEQIVCPIFCKSSRFEIEQTGFYRKSEAISWNRYFTTSFPRSPCWCGVRIRRRGLRPSLFR